jgi:hypothetical protein
MKTKFYQIFLGLVVLVSCTTGTSSKKEQSLNYQIVENSKLIEDTLYYKIDFQYPYFTSSDQATAGRLNLLNDSVQNFLNQAQLTYWGVDTEGAIEIIQETGTSGKYELMNRYEIYDTTNFLVSFKMETYSFALGAHGFTAINTCNFDLGTGKFLKLTDVIDLSGESKLVQFNQLLVADFVNTEDCFTEKPKVDSTYEKFAISPDFLVVYFEAYELGPYCCGSAEILISIDELQEAGLWKMPGD